MQLYTKQIPHTEQIVLAGDHTAWSRLEAVTLKERTYEHQAKPMSGTLTCDSGARLQHHSMDSVR